MRQRHNQTALKHRPARAAFALLAAGTALYGCEAAQTGHQADGGRAASASESAAPAKAAGRQARDAPGIGESARKAANSVAPDGTGMKDGAAKPLRTVKERLVSAATQRVWEMRERINATPDQDLHVTVTLSVGAAGRPVSVMGATASTKRGGASRDVSDILALDTSGISMESTGVKRQAVESVVIPGE